MVKKGILENIPIYWIHFFDVNFLFDKSQTYPRLRYIVFDLFKLQQMNCSSTLLLDIANWYFLAIH
jgi:hypothetical protein